MNVSEITLNQRSYGVENMPDDDEDLKYVKEQELQFFDANT